eukprot:5472601-Pleurochrysis_carterae.AAC.3
MAAELKQSGVKPGCDDVSSTGAMRQRERTEIRGLLAAPHISHCPNPAIPDSYITFATMLCPATVVCTRFLMKVSEAPRRSGLERQRNKNRARSI